MRKVLAVTLICILALLFTSVGAVSAKANVSRSFGCDQLIIFDTFNSDHWVGTLSGCDLAGKVEYWETDQNYVVGKTEHFFETFTITPDAGGVINGVDAGVWNFSTFKFRANGWVTDATGPWTSLVGYKFHEMGTTTSPDLPVVYGPSTMSLH
jgi:hypothetical protein